jgi:hypothetical protein
MIGPERSILAEAFRISGACSLVVLSITELVRASIRWAITGRSIYEIFHDSSDPRRLLLARQLATGCKQSYLLVTEDDFERAAGAKQVLVP